MSLTKLAKTNDNPHPELERWLKIAVHDRTWPDDARPHIEGDALMICEPDGYDESGQLRLGWVAVRTRAQLVGALGYGPLFD